MLINFVRAVILYIVVLITTRLMGKRELGQLQPYEVVISIMIANLATIPMSDIGVPIVSGLVPIMGLLTMHLIISLLNLKSTKLRRLLCGKPNIIINKGKIDEEAMEKERFDLSELEERLREKDVFDIGDVDYAILETNGEVSVILKPEKQQPTIEDLNLKPEFRGISYNLILDGVVIYKNLKLINKSEIWLKEQIEKFNLKEKDVLIATMNEKGEFFCQEKEHVK